MEGATLISGEVIEGIISQFEGKELSFKTMQRIADLISDEYRAKGYITTRAFIPPQTIKQGELLIRVVEGKTGNVTITGNKGN